MDADSSCDFAVSPGPFRPLLEDQTRPNAERRVSEASDRIVCRRVELIMLGQGLVFLVAALTMLAR
jgi:hypothetical protein